MEVVEICLLSTLFYINLSKITEDPFYASNYSIHNDLKVPLANGLASIRYKSFHFKLITNTNPLVWDLSSPNIPGNACRWLKRKFSRDSEWLIK